MADLREGRAAGREIHVRQARPWVSPLIHSRLHDRIGVRFPSFVVFAQLAPDFHAGGAGSPLRPGVEK
jgi:hypothetical protein